MNRYPLIQLKNPMKKENFISLKAKISLMGIAANATKRKESQTPKKRVLTASGARWTAGKRAFKVKLGKKTRGMVVKNSNQTYKF
jgi:hypothetical protein